jgi:glycyl-tRNA synthetase beta chain
LHGDQVVPIQTLGLKSGRDTHGHRFEANVDPVSITTADSYAEQLTSQGAVIASFAERRAEIVRQLQAAAAKAGTNLKPIDDDALLDEVTALVERPNVLVPVAFDAKPSWRSAAGVPDFDHEGQSEVLPAAWTPTGNG